MGGMMRAVFIVLMAALGAAHADALDRALHQSRNFGAHTATHAEMRTEMCRIFYANHEPDAARRRYIALWCALSYGR